MQVSFTLSMPVGEDDVAFASEAAIAADPSALARLLDDDSQGQVLIVHDGTTMTIEDALGPLLRGLCLDAIPEVARDDYARVEHHKHGGFISISLDDDVARLDDTDSDQGAVSFPSEQLLGALVACGGRWVALVKAGFAGDAAAAPYLAELDARAAAAEAALGQVGQYDDDDEDSA